MSGGTNSRTQILNKQTFEFTKRKRWADLLINELSEAIVLILSPGREVMFCGAAVNELLGWKDEEFIDRDLIEFITGERMSWSPQQPILTTVRPAEDEENFRKCFDECLRTRKELLSYARLKRKIPAGSGSNDVLFELKGYPHFIPQQFEDVCKCFFLMAKPFPPRNAAMCVSILNLMLFENTKRGAYQRKVKYVSRSQDGERTAATTR